MKQNNPNKFTSEIFKLVEDLSGPSYFTNAFSDIKIKSLIILSGVFRSDHSYLGRYLARMLSNNHLFKGKTVLDLGCGCGLLGLICALNGAKYVHFSDINPTSIKNTQLNALLLGVNNCSYYCGSLFENIPTDILFDHIIFNPPSISGKAKSTSELALIRDNKVISRFYKQFPKHLIKNGSVIMPVSTRFHDELSPLKMVKQYGYKNITIDEQIEEDGNCKSIIEIKT
ncbi:methyltransferase [Patescibacteria group bacterium]|nr:methyltransferase [Patescibacteria group bacterium]